MKILKCILGAIAGAVLWFVALIIAGAIIAFIADNILLRFVFRDLLFETFSFVPLFIPHFFGILAGSAVCEKICETRKPFYILFAIFYVLSVIGIFIDPPFFWRNVIINALGAFFCIGGIME